MDKDFENYKRIRCNVELLENKNYMNKERDLNFPREQLQEEADGSAMIN